MLVSVWTYPILPIFSILQKQIHAQNKVNPVTATYLTLLNSFNETGLIHRIILVRAETVVWTTFSSSVDHNQNHNTDDENSFINILKGYA